MESELYAYSMRMWQVPCLAGTIPYVVGTLCGRYGCLLCYYPRTPKLHEPPNPCSRTSDIYPPSFLSFLQSSLAIMASSVYYHSHIKNMTRVLNTFTQSSEPSWTRKTTVISSICQPKSLVPPPNAELCCENPKLASDTSSQPPLAPSASAWLFLPPCFPLFLLFV
jgi:hypothetical protein